MTSDRKTTEWRRFCKEMEAIGVDPYLPTVPHDDERYEQVQAIVATCCSVPKPLLTFPESWEGSKPRLTSLDDVARWMRDEWSVIVATKMGGEDGIFSARKRASQTIRNAHRILDVMAIENRPTRQPPAKTLAEYERQMLHLDEWFRKQHESGWKPTKKAVVDVAKTNRRKRRKAIPEDEAELLAKRFLKENPDATSRELAKRICVAHGRVSSLPSWKRVMAERKARRKPGKINECQLTPEMLASIGQSDDPAQQILRDEWGERHLLEHSTEKERVDYFQMPTEQQHILIEAHLDHLQDSSPPEFG